GHGIAEVGQRHRALRRSVARPERPVLFRGLDREQQTIAPDREILRCAGARPGAEIDQRALAARRAVALPQLPAADTVFGGKPDPPLEHHRLPWIGAAPARADIRHPDRTRRRSVRPPDLRAMGRIAADEVVLRHPFDRIEERDLLRRGVAPLVQVRHQTRLGGEIIGDAEGGRHHGPKGKAPANGRHDSFYVESGQRFAYEDGRSSKSRKRTRLLTTVANVMTMFSRGTSKAQIPRDAGNCPSSRLSATPSKLHSI